MDNLSEIGKQGEILARAFLEEKGYHILESNFRYGKTEIDIIAFFENQVVFIEVKTRSTNCNLPEKAVNRAKQRNIQRTADEYLYRKKMENKVRFDIVSIHFFQTVPKIYHIEDAFFPRLN